MKQRLLIWAMVICFCVCLFTACNNTSNSGGGNPDNSDNTAPDGTHPSTEGYADGLAYSVNADGESYAVTAANSKISGYVTIPSIKE